MRPRGCVPRALGAHIVSTLGAGTLVARILQGAWRQSPPPTDLSIDELNTVAPLLLRSGGGALAWWRMRDAEVMDHVPAAGQLHDAFRMQVLGAAVHTKHLAEVFVRLRSAGVEPVLLKGWAAARMYSHPGIRPCSDIDLCVVPTMRAATEAILRSTPGSCLEVDLTHTEVTDVEGLIARSQLVSLGEIEVRIPSAEDHLRLLCIHALKHAVSRPLWLCDIAAAVETRPPNFSWPLLLGDNPRHASWIIAAIGLAHHLLGAEVAGTPVASAAANLPRWLVPSIIGVWSNPGAVKLVPPRLSATSLRDLAAALRERWANPVQASIMMNVPFNAFPRLPIQVAAYGLRAMKFLLHLSTASDSPTAFSDGIQVE